MMLATTAASSLLFFYRIIFYSEHIQSLSQLCYITVTNYDFLHLLVSRLPTLKHYRSKVWCHCKFDNKDIYIVTKDLCFK